MPILDRRRMMTLLAASMLTPQPARAATGLALGPPRPFRPEALKAQAAALAARPYRPAPLPDAVRAIDFDKAQAIRFRPEDALWRGMAGVDPVAFFHLNRYSGPPVAISALADGQAREVVYASRYFDYGRAGSSLSHVPGMGFGGFRVMNGQNAPTDWLAFQGASYFRSSGQDDQYGASARGIAVDTGLAGPEEFPRFSRFWLAPAANGIVIHALLEGPSVTGAYRFDCAKHGGVTMDVHCDLFARADIGRLGIAPLTSMYWYGENERVHDPDWRPEIHDSDGLALWTGKGERIWRPLVNPPAVQANAFLDDAPKGFGLIQRDRDFDHYQDDGAFYDRRPSIWVEPSGNWGRGAVQLVEIPTDGETMDNIVAFWTPEAPMRRGGRLSFDYRLYWQDLEPFYPAGLARAVALRIGRGGIPGAPQWPRDMRKFVIDFAGGALDGLAQRYDLEPVVNVTYGDGRQGEVRHAHVLKVVGTRRWRASFDVTLGKTPINLRCFVRLGGRALTETWIYQYLGR